MPVRNFIYWNVMVTVILTCITWASAWAIVTFMFCPNHLAVLFGQNVLAKKENKIVAIQMWSLIIVVQTWSDLTVHLLLCFCLYRSNLWPKSDVVLLDRTYKHGVCYATILSQGLLLLVKAYALLTTTQNEPNAWWVPCKWIKWPSGV